jgi:phosphopantetheinyl transferase (holo-ACP synthase)
MTSTRYRIISHTATVPLRNAGSRRAGWLADHFSKEERAEYRSRTHASVAGALALKQAAVRLYGELRSGAAFSLEQFQVSHTGTGAPELSRVPRTPFAPAALMRRHLKVSVAHSRSHAVAVVAYVLSARGSSDD